MHRRLSAALGIVVVVALALFRVMPAEPAAGPQPKYVIIMFADGAGPGAYEIGRLYHRLVLQRGFLITDTIMAAGNIALLSTISADSLATDSAAAGSAMFTGFKTNNGMVGMTPDKQVRQNLAEAAKARGMRLAIVTTDSVWDASPGAFATHAESRANTDLIAEQLLALEPEVLLGGGRDAFLPKAAGGSRADARDLIAGTKAKRYAVVSTTDELRQVTGGRVLGLFAEEALNLDLDRPQEEPSYADMVAATLRVLARSSEPFIALFENENTDTAAHRNDLPSLLAALADFERGVRLAYGFYQAHPQETLLIVASDHDTGTPSLTYAQRSLSHTSRRDRVNPTREHLAIAGRARASVERSAQMLGPKPTAADIQRVVSEIYPGMEMHERYQQFILRNELPGPAHDRIRQSAIGLMIAQYTFVYWGTGGHSATPVPIAALGVGADRFRGFMDNTKFASILFGLIGGR